MSYFDFLPDQFWWVILFFSMLFLGTDIYFRIERLLAKPQCANCSKEISKHQSLCEDCYIKYQDIFPKGWSNTK